MKRAVSPELVRGLSALCMITEARILRDSDQFIPWLAGHVMNGGFKRSVEQSAAIAQQPRLAVYSVKRHAPSIGSDQCRALFWFALPDCYSDSRAIGYLYPWPAAGCLALQRAVENGDARRLADNPVGFFHDEKAPVCRGKR